MNGIKRNKAAVQAAIDDMFYETMQAWDDDCRAMSSTGENMILESMEPEDYQAMRDRVMQRCIWKVARRLEDK